MHPDFLTLAQTKRNASLLKTEDLFTSNKSSWFAAFARHFTQTCTQIQLMQKTHNTHARKHSPIPPLYFAHNTAIIMT